MINLKRIKSVRPKRLFIAGSFGGDRNQRKRDFCLNPGEAKLHFDQLYLLNSHKSKHLKVEGFKKIHFPAWFFDTKLEPGRFIRGIFAILTLMLSDFQILRDVVVLELNALPFEVKLDRKNGRKLWSAILRGITGLGKVFRVFDRFDICDGDTVVVWSEHMPAMRLLKREIRRRGARLILSEYGELPGTMFFCDRGMFHESWPVQYKEQFQALPISSEEVAEMRAHIEGIVKRRISSKVGQYESGLTLKELNVPEGRPVIYINGAQAQASGLIPRCSSFSKEYSPYFGSNEAMLEYFAELAVKYDWTVLYKDHPNTTNCFSGRQLISDGWGDHVKILGNVDIYEILSLADLTISLGSKTVCLSLFSQVPVLLMGPYSINEDDLMSGVYSGGGSEAAIVSMVQSALRDGVDHDGVTKYFTRMMKYYYYSMDCDDESLFGRGQQRFWKDFLDFMSDGRSVISAKVNIED
jgi:hypothetical protein